MALVGLRADAAQPPRYRWNKTVLRMCFVQTLQRVKVNRLPGEQRRFYKFKARGQNKIFFSSLLPGSLVKIAIGTYENCEILQGNGSETTST